MDAGKTDRVFDYGRAPAYSNAGSCSRERGHRCVETEECGDRIAEYQETNARIGIHRQDFGVVMRPGIFFDTFLESFRNKMFLVFFVVSSVVIGSIGLALNMDAVNGMIRGATFFGTQLKVPAFTIREWVENLQTGLAMLTATVGLVLALMATSTLFPSMLQKGSIDLLLC